MKANFCSRSKNLLEREICYFIKMLPNKKRYVRKLQSEIINASDPTQLPNRNRGQKNSIVEKKALLLAEVERDIKCIEDAFEKIPEEYRQIIYDNFMEGKSFKLFEANEKTLYKYRKAVILQVALNKGYDMDFIEFLKNEI